MKTTRRALLAAGAGLILSAANAAEETIRASRSWRVFEPATNRDVSWKDFVARLAEVDAVFLGEQHDDPETHRAEAALLAALHEKTGGNRLVLAMEMLERDAQPALDDYLAGRITEADLAKATALWGNYGTDYRPLVEYARTRRLSVLASNAPRRIARAVSQEGLPALDKLAPEERRRFVAAFVSAPEDDYWERFRALLGAGHGDAPVDAATLRRFYAAQCLKDDTMAETVVRALDGGERRIVLHVNGVFHSEGGRGIPRRVLWRRPVGTRVRVVAIVPVRGDAARADTKIVRGEADFVVFVPDRRVDVKEKE